MMYVGRCMKLSSSDFKFAGTSKLNLKLDKFELQYY